MSKIEARVVYDPKLTFDNWAKQHLGIEEKKAYTSVTATLDIPMVAFRKSYKVHPLEAAMKDLVTACAEAYGRTLEGRDFYFRREIEDKDNSQRVTVFLYVIED